MLSPNSHLPIAIAVKLLFAISLSWFAGYNTHAQEVYFRNMFPDNPFSSATSIMQDATGNMWLTTSIGLAKYNGYSLTYYRNDPLNTNSLAGVRLECVYADNHGFIWVGMFGQGLDKFDPSTGIFTHYKHDPKDSSSLSSDIVTSLLEDRSGNFWVGTHGGLEKMDRKTGTFTHFTNQETDSTSLSNNQVRAIYQDKAGALWIGTGSPWIGISSITLNNEAGIPGAGGLNKMQINTGKFTRYMHNDTDTSSLINNKVRAMFEDRDGNFWIGTAGDGLHLMNRTTGRFQRLTYASSNPDKISRGKPTPYTRDHITFITQDITGTMWIGTLGGGLTSYNVRSKLLRRYVNTENSTDYKGEDESPFSSCISRDGVLWLTGLSGHVYTISPFRVKVTQVTMKESVNRFLLYEDSLLFMGTSNGLIKKNLFTRAIETYAIKNEVFGMATDSKNNVWFGSKLNGLFQFEINTHTLKQYRHSLAENSLVNDTVFAICMDRQKKTIWIGTRNGLDRLDIKSQDFYHYKHASNDVHSIHPYQISELIEDSDGNIWIGYLNGAGVDKLDVRSGLCTHYALEDDIYALFKASDGLIWIGGNKSLYKYEPAKDSCVPVLNPTTGEYFSSIGSIIEDHSKNLWLTTSEGLVMYDVKKSLTSLYSQSSGINPNALMVFAAYRDRSKKLYFGNNAGYYVVSPTQMLSQGRPPEIAVTNFYVEQDKIENRTTSSSKGHVETGADIKLGYNQNSFSFEFFPVDFNNPAENKLYYKLEDYDNSWRPASNPAKASYFNVQPGKYVFHVKAVNSLGNFSERSVTVIIATPWWRTWWAYSLFIVCIIAIVRALILNRSKALMRRNLILEDRVKFKTSQLQQSLDNLRTTQAQLIHSEKMASLGELTAGIAHEIQNPLNFVNNFSEVSNELIDEMNAELSKGDVEEARLIASDIKENLQKITHHGKRADSIVKGMLQHSGNSAGIKEAVDINLLVDEYTRLCYQGFRAKDKSFNVQINVNFDPSIPLVNIIPQDIGRVVLNIVNNAFYATMHKKRFAGLDYHPTITITTCTDGAKTEIRISDNGNGMPGKVKDKIFQPFFTTKPTGEGTGLGLSLSYDIITKGHGGQLLVETIEGEGTTFIISI